jgi:hypothetical protein
LIISQQASAWLRAELQSPALVPPRSAVRCLTNDLPGFVKLLASSSGKYQFIADIPGRILYSDSEYDHDFVSTGESPLGMWVDELTSIAREDEPPPAEPIVWGTVLAAVDAAGWTASRDGDGIKITIVQPGQFFEIAVNADRPCGLRISTELAALHSGSAAEREAALILLGEAHERLQLARMRYVDGSPARMVAEVRLSFSKVPNVWLLAALEAVYAAVVLIARPLAVLRGSRLAESVLAAHKT